MKNLYVSLSRVLKLKISLIFILFYPLTSYSQNVQDVHFLNGRMFSDNNGNIVRAHGPGVVKVDDTYYVIGEDRRYYYGFHSVNMYSTKDFVNWTFENEIISTETHPQLANGERFIERPKIIYNESTQEFVVWLHWEGYWYAPAEAAVFKCSTVNGDYEFVRSMRPNGEMARDCNLFVEDDGKAYFIAAGAGNATLFVHELTDDYLNVTGYYYPLFEWEKRESPVIFKENGLYYIICSGTTGWAPNENLYSVSTRLDGGWSSFKPIANSTTFNSQSAHYIKIEGTQQNQYVYIGDRWQDPSNFTSKLVFAPIILSNGGWDMSLEYAHEFEVDGITGEFRIVDSDQLVDKSNWSIYSASSTYNTDIPENAIDGDLTTFWHSEAGHPHELIIDMGASTTVNGYEYIPRQDGHLNGLGEIFELYISDDPNNFGIPVAGGWVGQQGNIDFLAKSGRYAKYVSHTSYAGRSSWEQRNNSGSFVSIAEFDLYTNGKCSQPIQGEYYLNGVKGSNTALNDTIDVPVLLGQAVILKPVKTIGTGGEASGSVIWKGPNGYFDYTREFDTETRKIEILAADIDDAGHYLMIYQDEFGCSGSVVFDVTVDANQCAPTLITQPFYATDGWWRYEGYDNITIHPNTEVTFGPQPTEGQSWIWTGPNGFTANQREVTYTPTEEGIFTFTVFYTNVCGETSSIDYTLNVSNEHDDPNCHPAVIVPYVNTGSGWYSTTDVKVDPGQTLTLGPEEWNFSGGTWLWSGCGQTANTREWSFMPTQNCTVIGTYTNPCGEVSELTFNITMNDFIANGNYYIVNRNSGKCLENYNGNVSDGTNVVQNTCDDSAGQEWSVTDVGNGVYVIVHTSSGLYADISGQSTIDGAHNIIWPANGGTNQNWNVTYDSEEGFYHILNVNSGLFLDITGASHADNAQNIQWTENGGWNQDWSFIPVNSSTIKNGESINNVSFEENRTKLLIYPNPTNDGNIEVRVPSGYDKGILTVNTISGKQVYKQNISSQSISINVAFLENGIYMLNIANDSESISRKIIVKK